MTHDPAMAYAVSLGRLKGQLIRLADRIAAGNMSQAEIVDRLRELSEWPGPESPSKPVEPPN